MSRHTHRAVQNDILKTNSSFHTYPYRPVLEGQDYVHFIIPRNFPIGKYTVAMTTQDTTNGPLDAWRGIGRLRPRIKTPWVHTAYGLQERAGIALLPDAPTLPRFVGEYIPGATYPIPDVNMSGPAVHVLPVHGTRIN